MRFYPAKGAMENIPSFLIKWLAAGSALFSLGVIIYALVTTPPPLGNSVIPPEAALHAIEKPTYTKWIRNKPLLLFRADRFEITNRSYLAFKIHALQQAVLHNVRITLFQEPKQQATPFSFRRYLKELVPQAARGGGAADPHPARLPISRVVFWQFFLTVQQSGHPFLTFQAPTGVMERRRDRTRFTNGIIEHVPTRKKIRSKTIFWDDTRNRFLIPGIYLAETPVGQAKGRGLQVGLDFSLLPMP